uniref:Uncharacterized protein n=1 Tax=Euplotes harpa TaxID=151035 RepID=A0A7S3NHG2_9SPIT|mmetsp:Transcript_7614/g.8595  ORF Transcript_7614/g.8595 Transcript_7614/m.8595 type:complete len:286 (+) Transcript_7614:438-1295(+)
MFSHIPKENEFDGESRNAYNAYRLDSIIRHHNEKHLHSPVFDSIQARGGISNRNRTVDKDHKPLFDLNDFDDADIDISKGDFSLDNGDDKNISRIEDTNSRDETRSLHNLHRDLSFSLDPLKKSKITNSTANQSKMSSNFLAVSREKNQKRQYFDWNNKPMLLINQNEIEPRKHIESHNELPLSTFSPDVKSGKKGERRGSDLRNLLSLDINEQIRGSINKEINELSRRIIGYLDYNSKSQGEFTPFQDTNEQLKTPMQRRQELNNVKVLMKHREELKQKSNSKK